MYDKVVWSEGLFLRPQLFQQQERYLEHFAHCRAASLSPFYWGFGHYEIDTDALGLGRILLRSAQGVFRDGTPFDISGHTCSPVPLAVTQAHLDQRIFLATPLRLPHRDETVLSDNAEADARFAGYETELADSNAIGQGPKPVQLARLRLFLIAEEDMTASWIGLPVARVKSIADDGSISLHEDTHIPPVTAYGASHRLREWVSHLYSLAHLRCETLANMLGTGACQEGSSVEMTDYFLLLILNRYTPFLAHATRHREMPPERLYETLLMMEGELATFVRMPSRLPSTIPAYDHADPYLSFGKLVEEIRNGLNQVLIRGAQPIPLKPQANNIWTAAFQQAEQDNYASLVLVVGAQMPADALQQQFLAQSKLSAPYRLPELIRSHLPGLTLSQMPAPPRQIPFQANHIYYDILRTGPFWQQVIEQGGLALHIAGHFPGLKLELWGVRKK